MLKKLIFPFLFIIFLFGNNFDKNFSYAQNYYWLTVDENIGSSVYFKSLKYLKLAYEDNEKLKNRDIVKYKKNLIKLNSLKTEIDSFYNMKKDTMGGYFPLLKFVSTSFFFFPKKSRQYTLQKSSDVIAISNATENLAKVLRHLFQYEVFFNSKNPLWNEVAFDKFNASGFYYALLTEEPNEALNDKNLINKFYENNIDKTIIDKFLNYIDKPKFYIVKVEKTPLEKGDSYFTAYGYSYNKNGQIKKENSVSSGYSIDMRWSWPLLISFHIILFLIVIIFYYFYNKIFAKRDFNISFLMVIFIGFLVGRILPWIIIPTIENLMPNENINVLYTVWWVALAGVAIILLPIYAFDFIYSKIGNYIKLPSIAGQGSLIGFSISAGVIGYLFVPYIFNYSSLFSLSYLVVNFFLFSVALLVSGYATGKVLDEHYKIDEANLIYFVITSVVLFLALMHGNILYINLASSLVIAVSVFVLWVNKRKFKKSGDFEETIENANETTNKKDLEEILNATPYYKSNSYKKGIK